MTSDEYKIAIINLLGDADSSCFSDMKQHFQLNAIAYGLLWVAEELHEINKRSKECTKT